MATQKYTFSVRSPISAHARYLNWRRRRRVNRRRRLRQRSISFSMLRTVRMTTTATAASFRQTMIRRRVVVSRGQVVYLGLANSATEVVAGTRYPTPVVGFGRMRSLQSSALRGVRRVFPRGRVVTTITGTSNVAPSSSSSSSSSDAYTPYS